MMGFRVNLWSRGSGVDGRRWRGGRVVVGRERLDDGDVSLRGW